MKSLADKQNDVWAKIIDAYNREAGLTLDRDEVSNFINGLTTQVLEPRRPNLILISDWKARL